MVETATTTTITHVTSTTPVPPPPTTTPTAHNISIATSSTATLASSRQNDEVTRGIFNLKIIVFLLLLPLILFAVFLKHLLDYLFALNLKEKDVTGKVALVRSISR
ncbi:hypothetical protein GQX74_014955 [Glossina fuscipes]|nr:hypothetical protein GQX74_014955 [Glossina fuscipes]